MSDEDKMIPAQISKAVRQLNSIRPGYESLLDLYEKIFVAQEKSKMVTKVPAVDIPEETLKKKVSEKFPLANLSDFTVDVDSAAALLEEICGSLRGSGNDYSEAAGLVLDAISRGALDYAGLYSAFLCENEHYFDKASESIGVDKSRLAFFIYNSAKPSLVLFAETISRYLDPNTEWLKGYCPICGSPASLSLFEKDGKRFLCCSFCWHKWPTRRIFCNNCENADDKTLKYYSFDNEQEHRVDVCDKCKSYIKTVDCRNADRFIYPPLEYISTPHIDIKMMEMGFTSCVRS